MTCLRRLERLRPTSDRLKMTTKPGCNGERTIAKRVAELKTFTVNPDREDVV
jgi:hypothetical protein